MIRVFAEDWWKLLTEKVQELGQLMFTIRIPNSVQVMKVYLVLRCQMSS